MLGFGESGPKMNSKKAAWTQGRRWLFPRQQLLRQFFIAKIQPYIIPNAFMIIICCSTSKSSSNPLYPTPSQSLSFSGFLFTKELSAN